MPIDYSDRVIKDTFSTLVVLLVLIVTAVAFPSLVAAAATGVEVTNTFVVADDKAEDGDILVISKDGLTRSSLAYDTSLFGVLSKNPLVVLRVVGSTNLPVVRNGVAFVNVTTFNGPINKGDLITSSPIAGKGQKAGISGYVLGTALESLPSDQVTSVDYQGKKYQAGKVSVAIRVEYAEISNARSLQRLLDYFGASFFSNIKDPGKFNQVVRYLTAGIIMILAFGFAFITFSRAVAKAIEAIGRNPLARGAIILSLGVSILVVFIAIVIGLVASIIILRI